MPKQTNRPGYFGEFGGQYIAETLMPLVQDLAQVYDTAKNDPQWQRRYSAFLRDYAGRPSPLYFAERLSAPPQRGENLF